MENAAGTGLNISPGQRPGNTPRSKQTVLVDYLEVVVEELIPNRLI
jgi:hypothetical protein